MLVLTPTLPLKHNINMNMLTAERRAQVISALVEGNSIRSVSRMTGIARNTIMGLLVAVGAACAEYQDKALRNLSCKRIQTDEIWAFCYGKDKNLPEDVIGGEERSQKRRFEAEPLSPVVMEPLAGTR